MKIDRTPRQRKQIIRTLLRPIARLAGVEIPVVPFCKVLPSASPDNTAQHEMAIPDNLWQHSDIGIPLAMPRLLAPLLLLAPSVTPINKPTARLNVPRILQGMVLSTAIGGLAYKRGSLSASGWFGAVLTGTLTFGFGGWAWGSTLITFFLSSTLLSHYKESVKIARAGEKFAKGSRRDFFQAVANGGPGALLALAYGLLHEPPLLQAIFVGIKATATADTWATELGVLSTEQPRLITTLKTVEPGTSGAITMTGTGASAAGGLLIGCAMLGFTALAEINHPNKSPITAHLWMVPAGLLGGLAGSLSDSLMSATVQVKYLDVNGNETEQPFNKDGSPNTYQQGVRWFTNDLVNLSSTLTGGAVSILMYYLLAKNARSLNKR